MKSFKEFLENYDPYMDPSQFRPDGTKKGKGWQGAFKNAKGQDVSEYSISVPTEELYDLDLPRGTMLSKPESLIPTIVPSNTDNELSTIVKATETNGDLPDSIVQKAFSHAQNQVRQGKSPFR